MGDRDLRGACTEVGGLLAKILCTTRRVSTGSFLQLLVNDFLRVIKDPMFGPPPTIRRLMPRITSALPPIIDTEFVSSLAIKVIPPIIAASHPSATTPIKECPFGSVLLTGSPAQYAYAFNPPSPNGLKLSGLLNLIDTGLNCRYPFPK